MAGPSPAEDLFPGRRYDGGLDSGFHSVDSGSKRWSGNEVSASFPRDIGNLSPEGEALSQDPLPFTSKSQSSKWQLELSSSFPCPSILGKGWLSSRPQGPEPMSPQYYRGCLPSLHFCIYSQRMTFRSCHSGSQSWLGSLGGPGSGRMAVVSGGVRGPGVEGNGQA